MSTRQVRIDRPLRWDLPYDPAMTSAIVAELLNVAPFCDMPPEAFSASVPLTGILLNDCRILELQPGDFIVREGDYGSSAFLIIDGEALVSLNSLPAEFLGRKKQKQRGFSNGLSQGWGKALAQIWKNHRRAEVHVPEPYHSNANQPLQIRRDGDQTRVFLHDIPRIMAAHETKTLTPGEIFGEVSAMTRSPRSATVIAKSAMRVLEIRWQGFREMMKRHSSMKVHIDQQYRQNNLQEHLRETPMFQHLSPHQIQRIADATIFETFGTFQWDQNFKSTKQQDISTRIQAEPIIVAQGEYVNGLMLIRNGFARLSRRHGHGEQTITYLGRGKSIGLREIHHNWKHGEQTPWLLNLRALGYVDVLQIPTEVVEEVLLPSLPADHQPFPLPTQPELASGNFRRKTQRKEIIEPNFIEFLVENRFVNGREAMVIDLDRCTRCDDCVRACASTHDNNPRFNRQGEIYDHWMVTQACMHCLDPVCMIGCPTGAIGREQDTGVVTINDQTCIGCQACANSCPYGNIQMVEIQTAKGQPIQDFDGLPILKATKCDLCSDQLGGPACLRACPHDALIRIDLTHTDDITNWSRR